MLDVCQRITAVDTSAEMHEINRRVMATPAIEYVVADLFEYRPDGLYDLIFAGYWLSHVPPGRFQPFWSMLRDALAPGGHVVMVDDGVHATLTARSGSPMIPPAGKTTADCPTDGEFTIVKMAYAPQELQAHLADLGSAPAVTLLTPEKYIVSAQPM